MQAQPLIDVAHEEAVVKALQEHPDWERYLQQMVEFESQPPRWPSDQRHWQWQEIHTPTAVVGGLIIANLVNMVSNSRSGSLYELADLEATRSALQTSAAGAPADDAPLDAADLFDPVIGLEKEKQLLRYAIASAKAVHAILIGPPASAKSMMLSDIGHLAAAEYYVGSSISKSGLQGFLLQVRPRILVIDEINTMAKEDMSPLYSLMADGVVTRLHHGQRQRVEMSTKVFAAANETRGIPDPILSRFAKVHLPEYTRSEFIEIVTRVLTQREGLGANVSRVIALDVAVHTTDVRDAVRVARMSMNDPIRASEVIKTMWPAKPGIARVK